MSDEKMDKATLRWNKIQKYLKTHNYIMNADVRELCGVSAATANRILSGLVEEKNQSNIMKGGIEHTIQVTNTPHESNFESKYPKSSYVS